MDDKAREKNREKVAKFRERQAAQNETAIKNGEYWSIPQRIDTTITRGTAKAVAAMAATTGTSKNVIIERALIEYCIKYREYVPDERGIFQPRKLKDSEPLPLDKSGRLFLNNLPKNKSLDFPPKSE